jgi:hypothetical protein
VARRTAEDQHGINAGEVRILYGISIELSTVTNGQSNLVYFSAAVNPSHLKIY